MKKALILALSLVMMLSALAMFTACAPPEPFTGEVKLELNGGTLEGEFKGTFTEGDELTLPTLTKEFFSFAGWYTDADFSTKVDGKFKPTAGGEITLYAKFAETCDFEYNNLEGATIANEGDYSLTYAAGVDTLVLPDISKEGHTFLGWCFDSNLAKVATFEEIAARTSYTRLYAKWGTKQIVLTYEFNGGTVADENYTKDFWYGNFETTVTVPTVTKADVDFIGWYTDAAFTKVISVDGIKTLEENTTLYARYGKKITVTYDKGVVDEMTYITDDHTMVFVLGDKGLKLPTVSDGSHSEFLGWYKDAAFTQEATAADLEAATADITIYARWNKAVEYSENASSVTHGADGSGHFGDMLLENNGYMTMRFEAKSAATDPTKVTYIRMRDKHLQNQIQPLFFFADGIYSVNPTTAGATPIASFKAQDVIEIVFKYDFTEGTVKLQYYVNGKYVDGADKDATCTKDPTKYNFNKRDTAASPKEYNYAWQYYDFTYIGKHIITIFEGDITKNRPSATGTTVKYETNGGKLSADAKDFFEAGEQIVLPTVTKGTDIFVSWYFDEALTDAVAPGDKIPNGSILYAGFAPWIGPSAHPDNQFPTNTNQFPNMNDTLDDKTYGVELDKISKENPTKLTIEAGEGYKTYIYSQFVMPEGSDYTPGVIWMYPADWNLGITGYLQKLPSKVVNYSFELGKVAETPVVPYSLFFWNLTESGGAQEGESHFAYLHTDGYVYLASKDDVIGKSETELEALASRRIAKLEDDKLTKIDLQLDYSAFSYPINTKDKAEVTVYATNLDGNVISISALSTPHSANGDWARCPISFRWGEGWYDYDAKNTSLTNLKYTGPAGLMVGQIEMYASVDTVVDQNGAFVMNYTRYEEATLPTAPVKDGFTFGGYYEDAAFTKAITKLPEGKAGTVVVYAKWTAN